MAKKYLLYIHNDEQFEKESNKSGLINELLNSYYGNFTEVQHVTINAVPGTSTLVYEDTSAPVITSRNKGMDFCKHNAVKGFCKKGCK